MAMKFRDISVRKSLAKVDVRSAVEVAALFASQNTTLWTQNAWLNDLKTDYFDDFSNKFFER